MQRLAYHKQLKFFLEIVEDRGDKLLVKHPIRGTIESPKSFYDLSLRSVKGLRNRILAEQKVLKERKEQTEFFRRKYVKRLIEGTDIKVRLSFLERDQIDAEKLVLIWHKKTWWLGSPAQQKLLIDHWADRTKTTSIERKMRRVGD